MISERRSRALLPLWRITGIYILPPYLSRVSSFHSDQNSNIRKTPVIKDRGLVCFILLFERSESFSCSICCVKEFMCLVRVGLSKIFLIQFLDLRIVMGLADHLSLIL